MAYSSPAGAGLMSGPAAKLDRTAVLAGQPPPCVLVIPDLPRADAARRWQLSVGDRGDVAVVRLRGELDFLGASVLRACLNGIRSRARSVADLAELALIDSLCLGVLVRHCREVRATSGSFALAAPQPAVRWVLSATGLLTWFEVHDTFGEAVAGARRSTVVSATPASPGARAATAGAAHGTPAIPRALEPSPGLSWEP